MSFALLALICAVAILGPILAAGNTMRVPVVIGELIVGIVLGSTGFKVVNPDDDILSFLAHIGFALVMFVAGSHVPIRQKAMARGLRAGILRALGIAIVAIPVGMGISTLFGTGHGALYAVLIASSSASIVMPALGTTQVTSRPGLEMLAQLAIADAACIVALPFVLDRAHAGRAALGALAVLAVAIVFYVVLRWAEVSGLWPRVHRLSEGRGLALELRVTLTMLFTLAAIAVTAHVSVMLAGFAMGVAIAAAREPRRLANQTFALTEGFFAPIFFVWLGSSLNLRDLAAHPSAIALGVTLGLAAIAVHTVGTLTKQPWPLAMATSAQLGVPVGAAALGKTMGILAPGEATAMLLGAIMTVGAVTLVSSPMSRAVVEAPGNNNVSAMGSDIGQETSPNIPSATDPRAQPPRHQEGESAAPPPS